MKYAITILLLLSFALAFFAIGRRGYKPFGIMQSVLRVIVALPLLISGIWFHFLNTDLVASIIPPVFPDPHFLAWLTGILEIAGAIGLFLPVLRRPAAFWVCIMMIAIFPANIYVAGKTVGGLHMPGVLLRTAIQVLYVVMVLFAGYGVPGRIRSET